jgi:hypothetical protein
MPVHPGQSVLDGKEPRIPAYRESAKTVWLLIIAEANMSIWFSPDENFEGAVYRTSFNRVFLYDEFKSRVIELKTRVSAL